MSSFRDIIQSSKCYIVAFDEHLKYIREDVPMHAHYVTSGQISDLRLLLSLCNGYLPTYLCRYISDMTSMPFIAYITEKIKFCNQSLESHRLHRTTALIRKREGPERSRPVMKGIPIP